MRNSSFDDLLQGEVYQQPALVPPTPWVSHLHPAKPKVKVSGGQSGAALEVRWSPSGSQKVWLWLLQTRTGGKWRTEVLPAQKTSRAWTGGLPEAVAVSAVNRGGEISSWSVVQARGGAN